MTKPKEEQYPPGEIPNDTPPRLGLRRAAKFAFLVSGLLPSFVLLLIYAAVSFEKMWTLSFGQIWPYLSLLPDIAFDSTKYKFPVFLLSTVSFPLATPLFLLLWSHFLIKATDRPAPAMQWRQRILPVMAATIKMSLVNCAIGGIALLATIALYIWRYGIPIPIVP